MNRRSVFSAFSSVVLHVILLTSVMAMPLWSVPTGKSSARRHSIQVSFASTSAPVAAVNSSSPHAEEPNPEVADFAEDSSVTSAASAEIWSSGLTDYLPALMLTEKPLIMNDIDPELSDRFAGISAQSMKMLLLINEYGDVDKVLFEDIATVETLPLVLRADLSQRFFEARFLPGRLHGQPVRSQLRIVVSLHQ